MCGAHSSFDASDASRSAGTTSNSAIATVLPAAAATASVTTIHVWHVRKCLQFPEVFVSDLLYAAKQ